MTQRDASLKVKLFIFLRLYEHEHIPQIEVQGGHASMHDLTAMSYLLGGIFCPSFILCLLYNNR